MANCNYARSNKTFAGEILLLQRIKLIWSTHHYIPVFTNDLSEGMSNENDYFLPPVTLETEQSKTCSTYDRVDSLRLHNFQTRHKIFLIPALLEKV